MEKLGQFRVTERPGTFRFGTNYQSNCEWMVEQAMISPLSGKTLWRIISFHMTKEIADKKLAANVRKWNKLHHE